MANQEIAIPLLANFSKLATGMARTLNWRNMVSVLEHLIFCLSVLQHCLQVCSKGFISPAASNALSPPFPDQADVLIVAPEAENMR